MEHILASKLTIKLAQRVILENANFAIASGECVAIVGANGCGKTTLLKMLCGLLNPSSGTLQIAALSHKQPQQSLVLKQIMGYAADHPPLYPHDTVYSYLRFIARLHAIDKAEITVRIKAILDQFSLTEYRNCRLHTLSKGTQQRVNLAQAIIHQPRILILDEPSNGLDQEQLSMLCNYIKQLRMERITVIIASHDYNDIIPLCDYMLRISAGQIQKILTPMPNIEIKQNHDQLHYST